jgi:hypothetical protein
VILRRKRLPDHLEAPSRAFDELIPSLERAKAALTGSVPGTRLPGRPLAETLSEFEEDLGAVRVLMDGWRAPEVERAWLDASAGLDESLELARRIRTEGASPEGFEGLIGLIGDLLAPLEAFDEAAQTFRTLRR